MGSPCLSSGRSVLSSVLVSVTMCKQNANGVAMGKDGKFGSESCNEKNKLARGE
jgi:hypothetical protein